jgi:hypothetical protein
VYRVVTYPADEWWLLFVLLALVLLAFDRWHKRRKGADTPEPKPEQSQAVD